MEKLETLEDKKNRVRKAYKNDPFSFIEKSDIHYAFTDSSNHIYFKKTGKELKSKMSEKLAMYNAKYAQFEAQIAIKKAELMKKGVEFTDEEYGHQRAKYPSSMKKEYSTLSGEDSSMEYASDDDISSYNDLVWTCRDINKDRKTLNILMENMNDNTSYQVTTNQLAVFEKSIIDHDIYGQYDNSDDILIKAGKSVKLGGKTIKLSPEDLDKLARMLSDEELQRTASGSKHEHHRMAAHGEMNRRTNEEASNGVPEEKMMDHYVEEGDEEKDQSNATIKNLSQMASKMGDPGEGKYDEHLEKWNNIHDEAHDDHKPHVKKVIDKLQGHKDKYNKKNQKKAQAYDTLKEKTKADKEKAKMKKSDDLTTI